MNPAPLIRSSHLLILACGVCWTGASANVGQSVKEVAARYGPGKVAEAHQPAEEAQTYAFSGLGILVEFWKGASSGEQYRKADGSALSDAEITSLLTSNVGPSSWYQASNDVWVRTDKAAVAYLGDNKRALVVQSYAFHAEVEKRRKQSGEVGRTKPPVAGAPSPIMTKIVSRYVAPNLPPDSFGAKPKTLYTAGETFARVEEEPDPGRHLHQLLICSEPDIWMINLDGLHGQHIVDPGPTFVTHDPLMEPNAPGELSSLEMGKEVAFFEHHQATRLDPQTIEGQPCAAFEYQQANYRLVLNVREDTHLPFQLDVFKDDKPDFSIRYLSYETNLPFNAALFGPPANVTITEAKPNP